MSEEFKEETVTEANALIDQARCYIMDDEADEETIKAMQIELMLRMAKLFIKFDEEIESDLKDPKWGQLIEDMKFCIVIEDDLDLDVAIKLVTEMIKWLLPIVEERDLVGKYPELSEMIEALKSLPLKDEE